MRGLCFGELGGFLVGAILDAGLFPAVGEDGQEEYQQQQAALDGLGDVAVGHAHERQAVDDDRYRQRAEDYLIELRAAPARDEHAAEAITAKGRNPRSELLAKTAIEKITKFLPQAYDDGKNVEARYEMALAANWAGIAFQDTDCHLGHCMADGISAKYHTPHGYNCIVVDPELMVECAKFVPDKVKIVGEAAGAKFDGTEDAAAIGKKTADAIRALMRRVGIQSPKESGMAREDFIECAKMAMEIDYGLRLNCPFEPTLENVSEIYAQAGSHAA